MNLDLLRHRGPERSASAADWRAARLEALGLLGVKESWDGEGALPVPPKLAPSAVRMFKALERGGVAAPDSVYPIAIGAVTAEWHHGDGTVVPAEIREVGRAEVLVWHPTRQATFEAIRWSEAPACPHPPPPAANKVAWAAARSAPEESRAHAPRWSPAGGERPPSVARYPRRDGTAEGGVGGRCRPG